MYTSDWTNKNTRIVKKNKNNFINVIGGKFAVSIR